MQEYLGLQEQYRRTRQRCSQYSSGYGYSRQPKPLLKLLPEALLSERDLSKIQSERLQYTQLLYRWGC